MKLNNQFNLSTLFLEFHKLIFTFLFNQAICELVYKQGIFGHKRGFYGCNHG